MVSYLHTGSGRLASATQDGNTTSFGYDGLGRNLRTSTDSEESTNVWAGMSVVQQTSDVAGTATLLRDALGQVALQSSTPGDISSGAAWSLQDRLGSTVAQTNTAGRITDLASYSDFGIPTFDSTGFASSTGFTGEVTDATTGLNSYFSRTYDPFAATWLSADSYRGTLGNPASQHRYGYVEGNPATLVDQLGFFGRAVPDGNRRPAAPQASAHTADGWQRVFDANPDARSPINSGSAHIPPRHEPPQTIQGKCGGSMSFDQRPCTLADAPAPSWSPGPDYCSNMAASMDSRVIAANQACAPLLMDQAMKNQATWQQDMYAWWKPLSGAVEASAPLLLMFGGLAAARPGAGTPSVKPAISTTPTAPTGTAVGTNTPTFVAKANGEIVIVPKGATGPTPTRSGGVEYQGGSGGGLNLSEKVTGVRIMEPHDHPKYPQPTGYVTYNNGVGQTVNPFTGRTIAPADPYWHWNFE